MVAGWSVRILAVLLAVIAMSGSVSGPVGAAAITDLTMTKRAKLSQTHRETITLRQWRRSPHGKQISWRESHRVCSAVSSGGTYRGKWQMSRSLWSGYGGRTFARVADRATCREQDIVARRIWIDQWWSPWGG